MVVSPIIYKVLAPSQVVMVGFLNHQCYLSKALGRWDSCRDAGLISEAAGFSFLKWWVSPTNPWGLTLLKLVMTWGVKWGENPPFQEDNPKIGKETIVFQPSIFLGAICLVLNGL